MKKLTIALCFALISSISHATLYENAEDGNTNGWSVYDNTPAGATISNVYDESKQSSVIELSGDGWNNGYILGKWSGSSAWNNTKDKIISWSMNYNERFSVYISAQTTKGHRYIYYTPSNSNGGLSSNGRYIHHGLGSNSVNGEWQTFTRDLQADLKEFEPDNMIISVNAFLIRGNGLVDDIEMLKSNTTLYEDAEDGNTNGWSVYDNTPAGAVISNVYDNNKQSNVIELNGDGWNNGYVLRKSSDGTAWNNTEETIIQWSMNYSERFLVYISVETIKGHRYIYYTPSNSNGGLSSNGRYIHHGLGSSSINGEWQTFTRDLEADLKEFESDNDIISVNAFLIRGNGLVDDIEMRASSFLNITAQKASRFLSRATFGAKMEEIEALVKLGSYKQWLEAEFAQTPNYHIAWAKKNVKGINGVGDLKDNPKDWKKYREVLKYTQQHAWWDIVVNGNDQLRQRVAFALSEIMVISKFGSLINVPEARMSYYDVLVKNAFGNFETLLQEVTYHPSMGKYLSYLGNPKADPTKGNRPDENYAREVMQLFTIGLYQLNLDGSKKVDAQGKALPTYNQTDIEEMAKVFTGITNQNGHFAAGAGGSSYEILTQPMISEGYEKYHDTSQKIIMDHTIPAGGDAKTDIRKALNILFNHSNTGPFIAKRLIQRLVTSNPSPAYIRRVSLAFNDNGKGIRGDMKAVIKAILIDPEALEGIEHDPETFGKVREPLLVVSNLFRTFKAQNALNTLEVGGIKIYEYKSFNYDGTDYTKQEAPLEALTVFNYFTPDSGPYSLKKQGLVAPEFEVYGADGLHQLLMGLINKDGFIYETYNLTAELQLDTEKSLLEDKKYDELLDRLDTLLVGGNMSDITKSAIKSYIQEHKDLKSDTLARYVIGLVMTSADYTVQR